MIIYKATNKITNKSYVGQTTKSLDIRRRCHERKDDKSYFQLSIEKYGIENFEWETICECTTLDEMSEKEIYYIQFYNTLRPNGYNLTLGGEGSFWYGDNNPSKIDITRKKISDSKKGKKRLDLSERNRSMSGKSYEVLYGKERADELKRIQSEQRTGRVVPPRKDTHKQSLRESNSIYDYKIVYPNGDIYTDISLRELCKKHNLIRNNIMYYFRTKGNSFRYKDYIISRIVKGY